MEIPGIELLRPNHAGALVLDDGRTINYGVIRIENDHLVYYTAEGLRKLWAPTLSLPDQLAARVNLEQGEEALKRFGWVDEVPISRIRQVLF